MILERSFIYWITDERVLIERVLLKLPQFDFKRYRMTNDSMAEAFVQTFTRFWLAENSQNVACWVKGNTEYTFTARF